MRLGTEDKNEVKTKKENTNLRQLFSQKLDKAEVIPDVSVRTKLMRQVSRKEFLRFSPARLNIYYVSGILISGITAAVLIFSATQNSSRTISPATSIEVKQSVTDNIIEVPAGVPEKIGQSETVLINKGSGAKRIITHGNVKAGNQNYRSDTSHQADRSVTANISSSLARNGLFTEGVADKKKLQGGFKKDPFLIEPETISGCAPFKLKFHNKSDSFDSCRWTFGDGGYSNKKDPEWIYDVEGEYKVILQVFRSGGKSSSSSATVTVHPRPQARFEISPEKAVLPKDEIRFLNYSRNAVRFLWDFGDGSTSEFFEPTHTYAGFSNYDVKLVVYSDWGCSDSLTVFGAFSGSEYYIEFPNAFMPNLQGPTGGYYSSKSDEAAQVFHPSVSGVTDYHLKIFSKLGITIFESNDLNIGWDGYFKGQLCDPGVYIWKVRGKYRNGEPFTKMGDVIMIKN